MAANVETMFSVRQVPWHGLGTIVQEAPTSADALRLAGLDWEVVQKPAFMKIGTKMVGGIEVPSYVEVPNCKVNVRSTDNAVLGTVTDRYKPVQNHEAFEFTYAVVGETEDGVVRYETAGSLNGGKTVWMLAQMPNKNILGDDITPYMCFSNSHDGKGAVRVCMTPVRVVCQNTLSMALSTAQRQWSTKHVGDMKSKIEEAKMCLKLANKYMDALDEDADRWANAKLEREQIEEILNELYDVSDNDSDRKKTNVEQSKADYWIAYYMPDIAQFRDTAWAAINAMSDYTTHATPKRNTTTFNEKRWGRIMDGSDKIMNRFVELVNQKIAV